MSLLRTDVLRRAAPDGGVELLDLLLERRHHLPAALAVALDGGADPVAEAALAAWLEARWLAEGPAIAAVRAAVWDSRARGAASAPPAGGAVGPLAADPAALPPAVAARWRRPEAWRRLGEARRAGAALLRLDGFLRPAAVASWRRRLGAARAARLDTAVVHAERVGPGGPALRPAAAVVEAAPLRALLGQVLGRPLASGVVINGWRLGPGDRMDVHPDGPRYAATFAFGLEAGWAAADGGAIAFGWPEAGGFRPWERWLPHAGDLLVFEPSALSFHCVEAPARLRMTVSGWWPDPPRAGP